MELFHGPASTLWILPILALAIAIEAFFYKRAKGKSYPWKESGLSLVIAIGHNGAGFVNHVVIITLLGGLAWNYRVATVPMDAWWAWPLLFILEEFAYYWYHRCAHRVRFMWSTHSVHHSPQELTLASAYRLAWTPVLSATWIFFLPLVLIGFHPAAVFGLLAASLLYQFWLHSTLIPKLGPLEWVLNTPSAHRVHHASNPEYLDMNFGGILIVFDRLFGTYKEEDAAVPLKYGLVHPITTNNPLKIVYGDFIALARELWSARSWSDRWGMIFKPPGWTPAASKAY